MTDYRHFLIGALKGQGHENLYG